MKRPLRKNTHTQVVDTCHNAGICKKTARLKPMCVIKG